MLLAASASICFNLLASVHFDLRCANGSMAISTPGIYPRYQLLSIDLTME